MNLPRISVACQEGHHDKCTMVENALGQEWRCICLCHSNPETSPIPAIPNRPAPPTAEDLPEGERVMVGVAAA